MDQTLPEQKTIKKRTKKAERVIEVTSENMDLFGFADIDPSTLPPPLPYYFEDYGKYRFVRVRPANIWQKSKTENPSTRETEDFYHLVSLYKEAGLNNPIHFLPLAKSSQETDPETGEKQLVFTLEYGDIYFFAWKEAFPDEPFLVLVDSSDPL